MRFTVLGPVTIDLDGRGGRPVKAPMPRTLLAALLLEANAPVSAERLVEVLWDDKPPSAATSSLRNHVMSLRKLLGAQGAARLAVLPAGYVLDVHDLELDLAEFTSLLDSGRESRRRGDWRAVAQTLARALELWQGEPFSDVSSAALRYTAAPHLAEQRLQAREWRIDAELRLGRHEDLVAELIALTREHRLAEAFHGQLMLALYRSGRVADALAAFRDARGVLVAELGLEPGPALTRLHERMLATDPTLLWSPGGTAAAEPPEGARSPAGLTRAAHASSTPVPLVPRQLPGDVRHFIGRGAELEAMDSVLRNPAATGPAPVAWAATGAAGVGKTTLAVHWAHRVKHLFPDGQLYINLRGFSPSAAPLPVGDALRDAIEALSPPTARIPAGDAARSSLYRSLLAERRILVVLDNAADSEQVRPLLPATPGCAAVVTSRSQLTGLVATEGVIPLRLDLFTHEEAGRYVAASLGRVPAAGGEGHEGDGQDEAVAQLVRICARLPLALSIATARASVQPGLTLASLIEELRGGGRPLDALRAGDPLSDVRAVFSWSYRGLSDAAARVFRLLSVHPGPTFTLEAMASLAATPVPQTREAVHELTYSHLLTADGHGRYSFHDLLRAYASELVGRTGRDESGQALHRLADHYLHSASAASRAVSPTRLALEVPAPRDGVAVVRPATESEALAWYDAEHRAVHEVIGLAADAGLDDHVWRTAWCLANYLERRGHWRRHAAMQRIAVASALRLDNRLAEAHARRMLARACARIDLLDEAAENLNRALVLYEAEGDSLSVTRAHISIAHMLEARGEYATALEHGLRALRIAEAIAHPVAAAAALQVVGWYRACLGDYSGALADSARALEMYRLTGNRHGEAGTLDTIAHCRLAMSDFAGAVAEYEKAVSIYREIGVRHDAAVALTGLGDAYSRTGAADQARQAWREALEILEDMGHDGASEVADRLAG